MRNLAVAPGLFLAAAPAGMACNGGDEAARAGTAATAPRVLTITATDFGFEAPDTVPAGFTDVRLVNHGDQPHAAGRVPCHNSVRALRR